MKITREVWVIMDKGHKVIACGTTRNRHVQMIDDDWSMRLITYNTEGKARAGYRVSQFYLGNARQYMEDTYGEDRESSYGNGEKRTWRYVDQVSHCDDIYEPVKATITLEI